MFTRAVLFALFLPLCVLALLFVSSRDNAGYSPSHLMNGRLAICVLASLAAAVLACFVCLAKAFVRGRAPRLAQTRAWLCSQRPAVWGRAAAQSALFCLLPTLLAEDYARMLPGPVPFSFARWLPAFLACALLLTPLFRCAHNAACQYAIACLPAVSLPLCRWFALYAEDARMWVAGFVLAAISLAMRAMCAKGTLRRFVPSLPFAFLAAVFTLASTFLWVYNKIVISPRTVTLGFGGLALVLLAVLVMACAGLALLSFFAYLQQRLGARQAPALGRSAFNNKRLFGAMFAIMAPVWLLWWWAYRPGNFSHDSVYQWSQAMGDVRLEDSQPVLFTLWLAPFAHISRSPAFFTFCQVLLCAAVYTVILAWMNRRGIPAWVCLGLAALLALLPGMGVHAVTVWKDVPFCLGVLWLGFLLARLARGKKPSRGFAAESAVALLVVACFRHNGIVVAGVSGVALLGLGLRHRAKQALAGVLAGLVLVVFAQGPLYGIVRAPRYNMGLSGLAADIIGSSLTYGADLPEDLEQQALAAAPKEEWVERYNPYHYFGYFNYAVYDKNPFFTQYQQKGPLWVAGMWMRVFARNPLVMFHERMSMGDSVLFVDTAFHQDAYMYAYENRIVENDLGIAHTDNALMRFFDGVLKAGSNAQPGQAILWRGGVWWIVGLWLLYFNFLQKRGRRSLFFVPILANVATLLVAVTEQGYRYIYNVIPYLLFGLLLAVMPLSYDENTGG